jgi:HEAT repeat protein
MSKRMNDVGQIEAFIADLTSSHGAARRRRARESLVILGERAITPLIATLTNPNPHIRWDAITALNEIGGPEVVRVLVQTLANDPDGGIRWLAAEGLINMNQEGLLSVLRALAQGSSSAWLREGAHVVIRSLAVKEPGLNGNLKAVLGALEDSRLSMQVSRAAQAALDRLTGATQDTSEHTEPVKEQVDGSPTLESSRDSPVAF